jgi:uncharacterized protein
LTLLSAVSTTLMSVTFISAAGLGILLLQGHAVPWLVALPFMAGALGGMFTGRRLARRLAGPALQRAFAVVLVLMALQILVAPLFDAPSP